MENMGRRKSPKKDFKLNIERFCIECKENLRAGISKRCSQCQGEREKKNNRDRLKR